MAQISSYKLLARGFERYVLAFPGRISKESQNAIHSIGFEIWDADFIANEFQKQIQESNHPYFRNLFLSLIPFSKQPIEQQFLKNLNNCKPGKNSWVEYQKLVGQILEHLFCPPLQPPLSESSNKFGINRRDFVFPNYSDSGFWYFLRQTYKADYIVVDAKNYKNPIAKNQILQIANYLTPHGTGLFAIIVCRNRLNTNAELTVREQWLAYNKMIITLNDSDLENMLLSVTSGGEASRVIGQAIENFRLSI